MKMMCPCSRWFDITEDLFGKRCQCPACGRRLTVPTPGGKPVAAVPVAAVKTAPPAPVRRPPSRRRGVPLAAVLWIVMPWVVAGVAAGVVVLVGIGVYQLIGVAVTLPSVDEAKANTARVNLKTLTEACDQYNLNNGSNPPSLAALAKPQPDGHGPILQNDLLKDPWGRPWGYDPSGVRNEGFHADIWVERPGGRIGNWPGGW
jgi:hypothetical protein